MRKVLIVKEYREVPDVIVVTLKQAEKFIQSLKDAHFEEVVLQAPEEGFNNNKLFIYVPRILRHGGVLKLEGFSKEDQAKVTGVIVGLGLKAEPAETQQTITFSKPNLEGEKVVESQAPLHIGFHAGVTPSEKEKIDEADLLKDDVIVKKSKPEDCAVKPKACANCKCGRKEQQQQQSKQETVKQIQQGTVKSNCGSCYLGDAFRCATCPYKGLPAFKPGDKIEIPNADGVTEASEASVTKVQGGKVKLDLADD